MADKDHATDTVKDRAHAAADTAHDALGKAKDGTAQVLETARTRASDAYTAAKEAVGKAGTQTAQTIDAYPVAAIAGGIVLGVALGALLPKTDREAEALGPVGARIGDAARQAFRAGIDAGKQSFADMGFSPDAAKGQAQKFVESIVSAAREAGTAAAAKAGQAQ